ncbi:MAG: glycosyltransferase family 2 protein [Candidatus Jordarchaeaceae archaeon]
MDSGNNISVIVINYNGKHYLEECFSSLEKQTYKNFDAYLLDNASKDGSPDYVAHKFPWVKILRFDKNYGFAKAYNKAIDIIKSKYVVLLNNDTVLDPKWLEELVKFIDSDEKIFAVGSKILFYDKPNVIQNAGSKATRIGAGIELCFGEKDRSSIQEKFIGLCGAAMLLKREIFKKIGGLDEDYFICFEDLDLCWRAWLNGYKTLLVPTSIVYHKHGGTMKKTKIYSQRYRYFSHRNAFYNIIKNFEIKNLFLGLILYFGYTLACLLISFALKQKETFYSILNGTIDALKGIKKMMAKRKIIQATRVVSDKYLFNQELISGINESIKEFLQMKYFKH